MAIDNDNEFVTSIPGGGCQLLCLYDDEIIDQEPVLAFLVFKEPTWDNKKYLLWTMPVTAVTVYDLDSQEYALLRPDGKVEEPDVEIHGSLDAFKAKLAERAAEKKKLKAATNV